MARRFPPPWSVEPTPSGFRVTDANGVVVAWIYGKEPQAWRGSDLGLTLDEARRIALGIARLPVLAQRSANDLKKH